MQPHGDVVRPSLRRRAHGDFDGCSGRIAVAPPSVVVVRGSVVLVVLEQVIVVVANPQSSLRLQFGSRQSTKPLPSSSLPLKQSSQASGDATSLMQIGGPPLHFEL